MSLATNVTNLATSVATAVKETRNRIGDLASLATTDKSSTVAAINEVAASAASATGIDDNTTTTTTTWSSQKISDELDAVDTTGLIDDTAPSTTAVYSSTKTESVVSTAIGGLAAVATSGAYTDLTGTVPQSALPAVALTEYLGEVADETAMLALTGQRGDWATRTDLGTDWQLVADNPAVLVSWREMTYPTSPVSSVNGRTGAVTGLAEATDVGDLTGWDPVATFEAGLL